MTLPLLRIAMSRNRQLMHVSTVAAVVLALSSSVVGTAVAAGSDGSAGARNTTAAPAVWWPGGTTDASPAVWWPGVVSDASPTVWWPGDVKGAVLPGGSAVGPAVWWPGGTTDASPTVWWPGLATGGADEDVAAVSG
jgi:hypothetical protein